MEFIFQKKWIIYVKKLVPEQRRTERSMIKMFEDATLLEKNDEDGTGLSTDRRSAI